LVDHHKCVEWGDVAATVGVFGKNNVVKAIACQKSPLFEPFDP
jgi:hypothetical protein